MHHYRSLFCHELDVLDVCKAQVLKDETGVEFPDAYATPAMPPKG